MLNQTGKLLAILWVLVSVLFLRVAFAQADDCPFGCIVWICALQKERTRRASMQIGIPAAGPPSFHTKSNFLPKMPTRPRNAMRQRPQSRKTGFGARTGTVCAFTRQNIRRRCS